MSAAAAITIPLCWLHIKGLFVTLTLMHAPSFCFHVFPACFSLSHLFCSLFSPGPPIFSAFKTLLPSVCLSPCPLGYPPLIQVLTPPLPLNKPDLLHGVISQGNTLAWAPQAPPYTVHCCHRIYILQQGSIKIYFCRRCYAGETQSRAVSLVGRLTENDSN